MKRRRILLAVLLLAVIGAFAWLLLRTSEPPEPVYQGKKLSDWLQAYTLQGAPMHDEVQAAVRQIGTNAIPTLLRLLRANDSAWKLRTMALAKKQPFFKVRFIIAADRHAMAYYGFQMLATGPTALRDQLVQCPANN